MTHFFSVNTGSCCDSLNMRGDFSLSPRHVRACTGVGFPSGELRSVHFFSSSLNATTIGGGGRQWRRVRISARFNTTQPKTQPSRESSDSEGNTVTKFLCKGFSSLLQNLGTVIQRPAPSKCQRGKACSGSSVNQGGRLKAFELFRAFRERSRNAWSTTRFADVRERSHSIEFQNYRKVHACTRGRRRNA